jgi:hypothetical protein
MNSAALEEERRSVFQLKEELKKERRTNDRLSSSIGIVRNKSKETKVSRSNLN